MNEDMEGVVGPLSDEAAPEAPAAEATKPEGEQTTPEAAAAEGADTIAEAEGADTVPSPEVEAEVEGAEPADETKETRSQRRARQRREIISQLERDKSTLASENTKLQERLEKLEAPNADTFENPDDYTAARAAYETRKANIEDRIVDAGDADKAVDTAREAIRTDAFKDACAEARVRFADYDKVALGEHWKPTPVMMDVILDSDRSADLAYYLGAHPEEAEAISRLAPAQQAVSLGRIEASKLPDLKPKPEPQSKAPPPITPIRASAAAAEKSPSDMDMDEYRAWRRRNEKKPVNAK